MAVGVLPYIPEAVVAIGEALGVTAGVAATAELLKRQQKNITNAFCVGTALVVGQAYSIFHSDHRTTSAYSNPYANGVCVSDNTRVKAPINPVVTKKAPAVSVKAPAKAKTQSANKITNTTQAKVKTEKIKSPAVKSKAQAVKTASKTASSNAAASTSSSTTSTNNSSPNGKFNKFKKTFIKLEPVLNALASIGCDIENLEDALNKGDYVKFCVHLAKDVGFGIGIPALANKITSKLILNLITCVGADCAVDLLLEKFDDLLSKYKDNPGKIEEIAENFEDTLITEEQDANTLCNDLGFTKDMLQKCYKDGYTPHMILNEMGNGLTSEVLNDGWQSGKTTKQIIESLGNDDSSDTSYVNNNKETLNFLA